MRHKSKKHQDSGVAAVELAILIPIFVLLIGGILEFGHAWYIKQAITSASREGARYGIVYRTVTGGTTRLSPLKFDPTIEGVIDAYLSEYLSPKKYWDVPTPTLTIIPGNTKDTDAGNILTVTVTADKTWLLFKGLGIGMDDPITISATTTMRLE